MWSPRKVKLDKGGSWHKQRGNPWHKIKCRVGQRGRRCPTPQEKAHPQEDSMRKIRAQGKIKKGFLASCKDSCWKRADIFVIGCSWKVRPLKENPGWGSVSSPEGLVGHWRGQKIETKPWSTQQFRPVVSEKHGSVGFMNIKKKIQGTCLMWVGRRSFGVMRLKEKKEAFVCWSFTFL